MRKSSVLIGAVLLSLVSAAGADELGGTPVSASVALGQMGDTQVVFTPPAQRQLLLTSFCASTGANIRLAGQSFGGIAELSRQFNDSMCFGFPQGFVLPRGEILTCSVRFDFTVEQHFCSIAGRLVESRND